MAFFIRILLVKKNFKFHAPVQKCHFGEIEKLPNSVDSIFLLFITQGSSFLNCSLMRSFLKIAVITQHIKQIR